MFRHLVEVEVDPEAWPFGDGDIPIDHPFGMINNPLLPIHVKLVEDLLNEEVRCAGGELEADRR